MSERREAGTPLNSERGPSGPTAQPSRAENMSGPRELVRVAIAGVGNCASSLVQERAKRLAGVPGVVGARGCALEPAAGEAYQAPIDALRSALVDAGVPFRVVHAARRYRWNGPMLTPVVMELHVSGDEATLQAWWEDVWASWPTIRLGRESTAQRPTRRATPIAQITRLFAALGH